MAMGDVVTFTETGTSTNIITVACTSGSCGMFNLESGSFSLASTSAEGVYAYADTDNNPNNGVSDIYAALISRSTFAASENPSADYPSSIVVEGFPAAGDHRDFMDGLRASTVTRADIENPSNYDAPVANGNQALSTIPFADLVVPVEFMSFTAKSSPQKSVMLDWATATELNNRGFEIEHSTDGKDWKMLDFEPGKGDSELMVSYQYEHKTPRNGVNYYRLKQVDYDGTFEYSNIAIAQIGSKTQTISISPNPVQNEIRLTWDWQSNSDLDLWADIYDLYGRRVQQYNLQAKTQQATVLLSDLPAGTYIIQLASDAGVYGEPVRFVKQ